MQSKQSFDFVIDMSVYGIKLGCLVGLVTGILMAFIGFGDFLYVGGIGVTLLACVIAGLMGLFTGLFLGMFAGFISGFFMMWVTQTYYREIYIPQNYKVAMGFVTVTSTAIFLSWMMLDEIGFALWLMSLGFAIHASQRVAHDYLRESDVRKRKAK